MHDASLIPGLGRSLGEENGNPLQYSCLENSKDRGAWRAIFLGVTRVGHNLATKHRQTLHTNWSAPYLKLLPSQTHAF